MNNRFWDLLQQSTIVSGLLALIIWGVICYLAVVGQSVQEVLVGGGLSIIGFFFGSKAGTQAERLRSRLKK